MTTLDVLPLAECDCGECGVRFAMPKSLHDERRNNEGSFYCPNGHERVYRTSEVQALRNQLELKEAELRASKCELIREKYLKEESDKIADRIQRRLNRVMSGVCPLCNRSFQNLKSHMDCKHGDQPYKHKKEK